MSTAPRHPLSPIVPHSGHRPRAPHVQAANTRIQLRPAPQPPGSPPVAPHVQAALAATGHGRPPSSPGAPVKPVQPTLQAGSAKSRPPAAPHVQAANNRVQLKEVPQPSNPVLAPHVQAALGRCGGAHSVPPAPSIQPKGHGNLNALIRLSSVVQPKAKEDLAAAKKNFGYFQDRSQKFEERGNEVADALGKLDDEDVKDKLADSLRQFVQTVLEQFEGHYQELREHSRLIEKDEPRYARFSTDKKEHPDLEYTKAKTRGRYVKETTTTTVAKEIKAVSSADGGHVTQVIKDACDQVSLREADRKKVLAIITESGNPWPIHGNAKPTESRMKDSFEEKTKEILRNRKHVDEIRVQGINLGEETYTATVYRKTRYARKWNYDFEKETKRPDVLSPVRENVRDENIGEPLGKLSFDSDSDSDSEFLSGKKGQ